MSENFFIRIQFSPNSFDRRKFQDIFNYPLEHGQSIYENPLKHYGDVTTYFDEVINYYLRKKGDPKPYYWYVDFGWFMLSALFAEDGDYILIKFNRDHLNPEKEIGREIFGKKVDLNYIYSRAEFLINFTTFIWTRVKTGIIGIGGSNIIHTYEKGAKEVFIDPKDYVGCYWLTLLPIGEKFPGKYSYFLPVKGIKPQFNHEWYINKKLKNGVLLVQSKLPWSIIDENPEKVSLEELEKKWKSLEKK